MSAATVPLTWSTALTSWQPNGSAVAVALVGGLGYAWCHRRARPSLTRRHAVCCAVAVGLFVVATTGVVGVYAPVLFWVRALQVLLLLMVIPFFVAMSRPVTALGLSPDGPVARILLHPATTSVAMLALPWLFYLTPWYRAALHHPAVMELTGALMLTVGFGYYYARLQTDPVPRRYTQLLSLVISIVESLGDGVLGLVLWLGPLIAADYYRGLDRQWGPTMRVDQSIGAGVLWLVGDVFGVFFVLVLMRYFADDEKRHARVVDAELDAELDAGIEAEPPSGLWWENDPQLRTRMGR